MSERRLLFIGVDKGSWTMRGKQIGEVLRAHYTAKPQPQDWTWAEVIILVKRAAEHWFREAQHARGLLIWDVLDFWRQPSANQRPEDDLVREVLQLSQALRVAQTIGATRAMADSIGGVYIPHQHRLGLKPAPIRSRAEVVAYDGSARYLGTWRKALERACALRGLRFVVNPEDLTQADLLVAFRDSDWDGWACRHWKSGVKYGNAIAAGRPILTQASTAFEEIRPVGAIVEDPADLVDAIDAMVAKEVRKTAYEEGLRREQEFSIERIAQQYEDLIARALVTGRRGERSVSV